MLNAMVSQFNAFLQQNQLDYYDEYGKGALKEIKWTDGKVSPKVYGYVPKETKKRR